MKNHPTMRNLIRSSSRRSRGRTGLRNFRPQATTAAALEARLLLTADPVISEFMASNKATIASRATLPTPIAYPDWIEIHNVDPVNALDVTGWYLAKSTKASNLQRFAIPRKLDNSPTVIPANGYLLVFASNQSTGGYFPIPAAAGGGYELHANFNLGASGDSAVLSKPTPDPANNLPVTIVSQYTWSSTPPAGGIGPQTDDVSYGLNNQTTLVAPGAAAETFIPLNANLGSTWIQPSFDDSGWIRGTTGVGYKTDGTFNGVIGTDVQSKMSGKAPDAFVRIPFNVANPAALTGLNLSMQFQDGFVAYLNGVEVAKMNTPSTLNWNSLATKTVASDAVTKLPPIVNFDITSRLGSLVAGTNVLAIQGLNNTVASTDFLLNPQLSATQAVGGAGFFTTPTPGAPNSAGVVDFLSDLQFDHEGGLYTSPFDLTISTDTAGATIRYTTDGSEPTLTNGSTYSGPIRIGQITAQRPRATTIVRAVGFKDSLQPTQIFTESYIYLADVPKQSGSTLGSTLFPSKWDADTADYAVDQSISTGATYGAGFLADLQTLPTISLVMDPSDLFDATTGIYANPTMDGQGWSRAGSIEIINPDGSIGYQTNASISMEGGGSRTPSSTPKHSFRLFFNGENGSPSKMNYQFFQDSPVDSFDTVILHATYSDTWAHYKVEQQARADYIKDQFGHDTHEAMGIPASHGNYMQLYVNGAYWGLYNPLERPDDSWAASYYGGNKEDWDIIHDQSVADGDGTRWNAMFAIVNDSSLTADQRFTKLKPYLDTKNFADYIILMSYTGNNDWDSHNWYAGANRVGLANGDSTFKFWAWDSERTLEGVNDNILSTNFNMCPSRIFQQLKGSVEFRQLFADEVQKYMFNNGALTPSASIARYLDRAGEIRDAIVGESARWGDAHRSPSYNRDQDWQGEVDRIAGPNGYFAQRTNAVLGQYRALGLFAGTKLDAPKLNQAGGTFSAGFRLVLSKTTTTVGNVYYTLDGSDPRLVGGALSPSAQLYTAPVALSSSVRVLARVYDGTGWSAIADATFLRDTRPQVRVSEISYHPSAPSGAAYVDDDYEFVEVVNTGPGPVDLAGFSLSGGVQFSFPSMTLAAGQHAVAVSNLAAFRSMYGADVVVAGVFAGHLSNSAAELRLTGPVGETVLDFFYNDSWYPLSDGPGNTLVINDPADDPNNWGNAESWHASPNVGGTPGAAELAAALRGVVVSELLANPGSDDPRGDRVELHNTTGAAIDVAGWYLSDSPGSPRKYRINSNGGTINTVIAAGGYLVLTEADNFGNTNDPGTLVAFGFDKAGDSVVLSSADSEGLTGYVDSHDFAASAINVPFILVTASDGTTGFVAEAGSTFGAANAPPVVGPVVINEIMYDPAGTDDEFIELRNVTGTDVALYDQANQANTWAFTAGITYSFPAAHTGATPDNPNPVIPAYGYALVTPAGITAAAFRLKYGIPAGVPIFAGYAGKLDNSGERLELSRPGTPTAGLPTPYIAVDSVRYRVTAPWPTSAQGGGPSLARLASAAYGDDPANWRAGPSKGTPGADNGGAANQAPVVQAGASAVITLPASTVQLSGSVVDDGLPNPPASVTTTWSVVSGVAANVSFGDVHALSTTASFAAGGVYVLRLTASDGSLTGTGDVRVTVNAAPTASAGPDRYVGLPSTGPAGLTLAGSASDPDALPNPPAGLTATWSVVSSPSQGTVTFTNNSGHSLTPTATFSTSGVYVLRLSVTDGAATATDDVTVRVNHAPLVDAGSDDSITRPAGQYTLAGTVSDDGVAVGPGGAPAVTSAWSLLSGPAGVAFADGSDPGTAVTFSTPGVYVLRLTASDGALTATNDVTITVVAAPLTPAGANFAATVGSAYAGVVGRFSDGDPADTAGQFTATIDWGDGQTSPGSVSADPGGFAVYEAAGSAHAYAVAGSYTVTVQVVGVGGASATIVSQAAASDPVVIPDNTPPTAAASSATLDVAGTAAVTLSGSDAETPAAGLSFTVTSLPASGVLLRAGSPVVLNQTFSGSPASLTYAARGVTFGALADSFTYTVTDAGGLTGQPATVSISSPAGESGVVRIAGTSAADAIAVGHSADNLTLTVTLNGVVVSSSIPLASIAQVRVLGREGDDSIRVTDLARPVYLDGGAGLDAITLTGSSGDDAIVLNQASATLNGAAITGTFSAAEPLTINGSSGNDTFTVAAAAAPFALQGDAGNDTFAFNDGAGVTSTVDGGAGSNTLDDSLYTTAVAVNLAAHTATGTAGIANLANVVGGSAGDLLVGDALVNVIRGNAGDDVLSGGGGADTLDGGADSDRVREAADANFTLKAASLLVGSVTETLAAIEAADLTGGASANTFTVSGWTGTGSLAGGGGSDTVVASKDTNFTLSDSALASSDGMSLALAGIGTANLTGGTSANAFGVLGWTGKGALVGGGGTDVVAATKDAGFTLSTSSLTSTDGMTLSLSAIGTANLTGGASANAFDVSGWGGKGALVGGGGPDTVVATKDTSFTLTDAALTTSAGLSLTLAGIGAANLAGGASANTFTVTGWTGTGSLAGGGGSDTVSATADANFVLGDASLAATTGMSLALAGIGTAKLTGGAGDNRFDLRAWTGAASVTGSTGTDTLDVARDAGFVLGASALAITPVAGAARSWTLSGVEVANLTGGASSNTFDVSAWVGSGLMSGGGGLDTIAASKDTNYTLTDSSLFSTTSVRVTLAGIRNAALSAGSGNNTFNVSGWTGTGSLAGGGGSNTLVATKDANFSLSTSSLTATDGLSLSLTAFGTANLTGGAGNNTFSVSGWTGKGALAGGGGSDTVAVTKDAGFTLSNSALTATDGLNLSLAAIGAANLAGGASANTFTVSGWTGTGSLAGGGGSDTLVASKDTNFTLSNASLTTAGGMNLSLSAIGTANLTGGSGSNTFNVSGWTGKGALAGGTGGTDVVVAAKDADFTLSKTSLTATDGLSLSLSAIGTANLAGGASANTFTVSGWTGKGSLVGGGGADTVAATKDAGYTLTDAALTATDGLSLSLAAVTLANLTVSNPTSSRVADASKFTGASTLTAAGAAKARLIGGAGADTLTASGTGTAILVGNGGSDTLRATGTGRAVLIGGAGSDTLTGNGNALLIGGSTTYDSSTSALDAILAEWASADTYAVRVSTLLGGGGANGTTKLSRSSIVDDLAANILADPAGATAGWFIANARDQVTSRTGETVTIY